MPLSGVAALRSRDLRKLNFYEISIWVLPQHVLLSKMGCGDRKGRGWDRMGQNRLSLSSLEWLGEQPLASLVITFHVSFWQIHIKKKSMLMTLESPALADSLFQCVFHSKCPDGFWGQWPSSSSQHGAMKGPYMSLCGAPLVSGCLTERKASPVGWSVLLSRPHRKCSPKLQPTHNPLPPASPQPPVRNPKRNLQRYFKCKGHYLEENMWLWEILKNYFMCI